MTEDLSWGLFLSLSGMKFLEFTIWGAWAPVLASRLLGPLKMSGKQLGWIYATLPLACIVAPMAAGQVVDRWVATEQYMGVSHLLGGVFLLLAARATSFLPLFLAMLGHCLCFAPTLAMVNSLTFAHLPNPQVNYFWIRMWGAVSWVLIGWALTFWRRSGKLQIRSADSLILGAVCAFVMGLYCFTLPHTPPANTGASALPFVKAFSLLGDGNFLMFLVISFRRQHAAPVLLPGHLPLPGRHRHLAFVHPGGNERRTNRAGGGYGSHLAFTFTRLGFQWTLAWAPPSGCSCSWPIHGCGPGPW